MVSDWDMYCITGVVSQAAVNSETNFHIHVEQVESNIAIDEIHLCYLIQVDDYADSPTDTEHLGSLPILTTWSDSEGYSNGYLFPIAEWAPNRTENVVSNDADVFLVSGGVGVFCVPSSLVDLSPERVCAEIIFGKRD